MSTFAYLFVGWLMVVAVGPHGRHGAERGSVAAAGRRSVLHGRGGVLPVATLRYHPHLWNASSSEAAPAILAVLLFLLPRPS